MKTHYTEQNFNRLSAINSIMTIAVVALGSVNGSAYKFSSSAIANCGGKNQAFKSFLFSNKCFPVSTNESRSSKNFTGKQPFYVVNFVSVLKEK